MRKNTKQSRSAAESDNGDNGENDNEAGETDNGKDKSDSDSGPYAWIGEWIQKPRGERCWKSKGGRKGFTTEQLLKTAKITKGQYSMYKVRLRFPFGHITDSPQKTVHQLTGRYFDIAKSFRTNIDNSPDSWALIIKKVWRVSFLSMF